MSLGDAFAQEMQHEFAGTRKYLEVLPYDKLGWKPHEKSMTLGALAGHLIDVPGWTPTITDQDHFAMNPGDDQSFVVENREQSLAQFDESTAQAIELLKAVPDEAMFRPWKMSVAGETFLELPKMAVIRAFLLNHTYHHRGQLSVYLRLLDVEVPAVYGPTADFPDF